MKTIAIIGLGLMGSSLGLALKRRGVPLHIRAYARRAETRDAAQRRGAVDAVFDDPAEAVKGANLVIFCLPVLTIPELAKASLPGLDSTAVLTDVGSTKAELALQMEVLLDGTGAVFVGSHPICGSEQQGIEAGDADLYEGSVTVVTPSSDGVEEAVSEISTLWKHVGSTVRVMASETHDRILATTSHLPHVVAAVLVRCVEEGLFCGTGFRDTTRIVEGSPEVWSDIVRSNTPALQTALNNFRRQFDAFDALVAEGDGRKLAEWFAASCTQRKELLK